MTNDVHSIDIYLNGQPVITLVADGTGLSTVLAQRMANQLLAKANAYLPFTLTAEVSFATPEQIKVYFTKKI